MGGSVESQQKPPSKQKRVQFSEEETHKENIYSNPQTQGGESSHYAKMKQQHQHHIPQVHQQASRSQGFFGNSKSDNMRDLLSLGGDSNTNQTRRDVN